jgi:ATP-dependent Clp protease ATP-binding subunit ClpC
MRNRVSALLAMQEVWAHKAATESTTLLPFTPRLKGVLAQASHVAQNLEHNYLGTNHLLLVLQSGADINSPLPLPFTPRARKVLERAQEEAQSLGHDYIGTEHLLLGLLSESDGPAAQLLQTLGIKPEELREKVMELLRADPPAAAKAEE